MKPACMWTLTLLTLALLAGPSQALFAQQDEVIIQAGSGMRYLANLADPELGPEWITEDYDDASWTDGIYGVGYDTGSGAQNLIQTAVPSGSASVFTRVEFSIVDVTMVTNLFIGADYDDGAIAWINGVEVYRSPQMPAGFPAWNTPSGLHESSNGIEPDYGRLQDISDVAISELHNGTNVLVFGVWNAPLPSSDLVLVPFLIANKSPAVSRGPYLQSGTPTSLHIIWHTDVATDSRVQYGPAPGNLPDAVESIAITQEHEILLDGLTSDTRYYYSVGNAAGVLSGDDADHYFQTSPLPGDRSAIRVWVIGDSGAANANARAVRDAYDDLAGGEPTDVWLMLGDNAYPSGTDDEYQAAVFDTYPGLLKHTLLWPTFGNHDAVSASSLMQTGPYYEIFTLPIGGEAGGLGSGTEAYYSFDFGNIHFVSLNSQDIDRSPPPDGIMLSWLRDDLLATTQDWIIAYWHHPPYSKGSHNSDTETQLIQMRTNALPVLEDLGVDIVFSGHSHSYERSYLLDGHYGLSGTLNEAMKLDGGDGRIDGGGAYQKPTQGPGSHEGSVYMVAGSASINSGGDLNHPAMFLSLAELGSVVLDVEGDRLEARFLDSQGAWRDYFTLVKNTATPPQADFSASSETGVIPLQVEFSDLSSTNSASWMWDLDGDGNTDSTTRSPAFVYTDPGTYTVHLTVANDTASSQMTQADLICASAGVPEVVSELMMDADQRTLTWQPAAAALSYVVLRGDLLTLLDTGGDFAASVSTCLESGETDLVAVDRRPPPKGGGLYYLVGGTGYCGEMGTYDSGGTSQAASRDPGLQSAADLCP